jgi:hypothetical protein
MTLLINELISLLEKDNKSNNDNSKIITANNPEKIYNNLISLLSKNIEDFITATESKEDILLRGLNDLKARREEQDTIASKVQYNNNNYNRIIEEEPDKADKETKVEEPAKAEEKPIKPVEIPKEESKKTEEEPIIKDGLMDKFKWVLVGFGILIFLIIIIVGVYYYYFSYNTESNTTHVPTEPIPYVVPRVTQEYNIPPVEKVLLKPNNITQEQPSSFMSMFTPNANVNESTPYTKVKSAVPTPLVQEPPKQSSSFMSIFAPVAATVPAAITAPTIQSIMSESLINEPPKQSSSFMSVFTPNTEIAASSNKPQDNHDYPLQKTLESKESISTKSIQGQLSESKEKDIEQLKKTEEPDGQQSIFSFFSTQKKDDKIIDSNENIKDEVYDPNKIVLQRTNSTLSNNSSKSSDTNSTKSTDTNSTKSTDTNSTKSSKSSKNANSIKSYNPENSLNKNETIETLENKIQTPIIKGGGIKKKK